mmetsp:Transcript_9623/g.18176  ORF Transcript_9623/g.18176 Transcript_9623/m.18176 type:complete len:231 (+) Transcript_9623:874-1566(+)
MVVVVLQRGVVLDGEVHLGHERPELSRVLLDVIPQLGGHLLRKCFGRSQPVHVLRHPLEGAHGLGRPDHRERHAAHGEEGVARVLAVPELSDEGRGVFHEKVSVHRVRRRGAGVDVPGGVGGLESVERLGDGGMVDGDRRSVGEAVVAEGSHHVRFVLRRRRAVVVVAVALGDVQSLARGRRDRRSKGVATRSSLLRGGGVQPEREPDRRGGDEEVIQRGGRVRRRRQRR